MAVPWHLTEGQGLPVAVVYPASTHAHQAALVVWETAFPSTWNIW